MNKPAIFGIFSACSSAVRHQKMSKSKILLGLSLFLFLGPVSSAPYFYVGMRGSYQITVIDSATNTVIKIIPGARADGKIFVSPNGRFAYTENKAIDTATHNVVGDLGTDRAAAFSPDSRYAYLAANNPYQAWLGGDCRYGGGLHIYKNSLPFEHLACISSGEYGPSAVSASPDGRFVYIDSYYNRNDSLRVVNADTRQSIRVVHQ